MVNLLSYKKFNQMILLFWSKKKNNNLRKRSKPKENLLKIDNIILFKKNYELLFDPFSTLYYKLKKFPISLMVND